MIFGNMTASLKCLHIDPDEAYKLPQILHDRFTLPSCWELPCQHLISRRIDYRKQALAC
jgi:hypothetical protein